MTPTMIAFHGRTTIKQEYVARVLAYKLADEIAQRVYYDISGGKPRMGAVGCTLNGGEDNGYETELGIPMGLAIMEDLIFDGLPYEDAKEFPLQFLSAVPVGADLSRVALHFLIWILADENHGLIRFARDDGKAVIQAVVALYTRRLNDDEPTAQEWLAVAEAAKAAESAGDALAEATRTADAAGAARFAANVADAAVYAAYAGRSAIDATYAANYAIETIDDARPPVIADFKQMRDKLLLLLAEAPI